MSSDVLGFNGERADPLNGTTHLGNGYRAYNPLLMRFTRAENLSPFAGGGINPYVYCDGDPVNHTDPSGHFSTQAIYGIGISIVGLGLSVFTAGVSIAAATSIATAIETASAFSLTLGTLGVVSDITGIASGSTEESNPKLSSALGWLSLATGGLGLVHGLYSVGRTGYGALHKLATSFRRGLSPMMRDVTRAAVKMNIADGGSAVVGRVTSEFLWSERQVLVHDNMHHYFMPDNSFAMDSRGEGAFDDEVLNAEYSPNEWKIYSANREGEVLPPFYISGVLDYQYTRVAARNHFFGIIPKKLISVNVQNDMRNRLTSDRVGQELKDTFLYNIPVVRLCKRRASIFRIEYFQCVAAGRSIWLRFY